MTADADDGTIRGATVRLRPIEVEDLSFLADLANDRTVESMVVDWAFPLAVSGQQAWFERAASDPRTRRLLVVGPDGRRLGMTGLWELDWRNRHAMVGVKLHPAAAEEKGLGTDTIKTISAWAFHDVGLQKLHATILDFNGPSMGAFAKNCGWKIEGVMRRHVFRKGAFHDLYVLSILREEFDALPDSAAYVERINPVDTGAKVETFPEWFASS